jgi:hypothetical protein
MSSGVISEQGPVGARYIVPLQELRAPTGMDGQAGSARWACMCSYWRTSSQVFSISSRISGLEYQQTVRVSPLWVIMRGGEYDGTGSHSREERISVV